MNILKVYIDFTYSNIKGLADYMTVTVKLFDITIAKQDCYLINEGDKDGVQK